jgi:glycerol-3-phosphate acyltransferase PlsY
MLELFKIGIFGILEKNFKFGELAFWLWLLLFVALCIAAGYFLGSLNAAVVISTKKYGKDIRTLGSGNAGMTNMFRVFGKTGGILTFLGDFGKTAVAILLGYIFLGYDGSYIAGLFAVIGHCFPIYYKFKGGKGFLSLVIMMLLCDPPVFLIMMTVFCIILVGTRMVSLASCMSVALLPIFINSWYAIFNGGDGSIAGIRIPISFLIAAIIVFMHRDNIKRIHNKEERKIRLPWDKKDK